MENKEIKSMGGVISNKMAHWDGSLVESNILLITVQLRYSRVVT